MYLNTIKNEMDNYLSWLNLMNLSALAGLATSISSTVCLLSERINHGPWNSILHFVTTENAAFSKQIPGKDIFALALFNQISRIAEFWLWKQLCNNTRGVQFLPPDEEVWRSFNLAQQMMPADARGYTIYNL